MLKIFHIFTAQKSRECNFRESFQTIEEDSVFNFKELTLAKVLSTSLIVHRDVSSFIPEGMRNVGTLNAFEQGSTTRV